MVSACAGGRYIRQHSDSRSVGVVGDTFGSLGKEARSFVARVRKSRGWTL